MKKNTVYLTLSAEIIHHGHINIINKASKVAKAEELCQLYKFTYL